MLRIDNCVFLYFNNFMWPREEPKCVVLTTPSRGDENLHMILGDIRIHMDVDKTLVNFTNQDARGGGPTFNLSVRAILVDRRRHNPREAAIGQVVLFSRKLIDLTLGCPESDFPYQLVDMDNAKLLKKLYHKRTPFDLSSIEAAQKVRENRALRSDGNDYTVP